MLGQGSVLLVAVGASKLEEPQLVEALRRLGFVLVSGAEIEAAGARLERASDYGHLVFESRADALVPMQAESSEWSLFFDMLADGMCLLDKRNRIVWCNRAMAGILGTTPEAAENQLFFSLAIGLPAWPGRSGEKDRQSPWVIEWTRGDRTYRVIAHPAPTEDCKSIDLLVVARDITERKQLETRVVEARESIEAAQKRIAQLEKESRLLQRFVSGEKGDAAGGPPPRSMELPVFRALVSEYSKLLELHFEDVAFRVEQDLSASLQGISERMGAMGAGPREVVDLHSQALRMLSSGVTGSRSRQMAEEGRLIVLELMGHLVSYYRANPATEVYPMCGTNKGESPCSKE